MISTFIATVFNEEDTIDLLLTSLKSQTKLPDEIIIVDGGSTDKTVEKLSIYTSFFTKKKVKMKILIRSDNRSVGRNQAVRHAKGDIIICSDAGCILDNTWIENIIEPFADPAVDVVAGYYQGKAETVFQKCLIPYVLVMHDKVDPEQFLPASRSMAFRKKVWSRVKGFPIQFSHNEDYVFAKELQKKEANIVFKKEAIVYWIPRRSLKDAFIMFYRFAFGDAESGQHRPKVYLLYVRYVFGLCLFWLLLLTKQVSLFVLVTLLLLCYMMWAINKNYRYIKDLRAFYILPALQFTADTAILLGSTAGFIKRLIKTD